jgi:hypothetical protein
MWTEAGFEGVRREQKAKGTCWRNQDCNNQIVLDGLGPLPLIDSGILSIEGTLVLETAYNAHTRSQTHRPRTLVAPMTRTVMTRTV